MNTNYLQQQKSIVDITATYHIRPMFLLSIFVFDIFKLTCSIRYTLHQFDSNRKITFLNLTN